MRVRSALLVSLALALLLSVGPGGVAAVDSHDPGNERKQDIIIELQEDGDAVWAIDHHYVLENETERERFEAFATEVRTGQRDVGTDRTTFVRFLTYAEAGTDRQMSIENAGWEEPRYRPIDEVDAYNVSDSDLSENATIGTLTYSFTWQNFAEVDGRTLSLQKTFLTASGEPWLSQLGPTQRLIIKSTSEVDFVTVPQGIENNRIVWNGPTALQVEDFDIVMKARAWPFRFLPNSWTTILGGLALLVAAGVAIRRLQNRRSDRSEDTLTPGWWPPTEVLPARIIPTSDDTARDGSTETTFEGVTGDVESPADDPVDASSNSDDLELLSDEERVTRLLDENGGRMKQAAIVDETGWSNAKVSQLLSQMDDDDEIEKLRIGRENLITLPDEDPTQLE